MNLRSIVFCIDGVALNMGEETDLGASLLDAAFVGDAGLCAELLAIPVPASVPAPRRGSGSSRAVTSPPPAAAASAGDALLIAAARGHVDCCAALLRGGADGGVRDTCGCTPLIRALLAAQYSAASVLLHFAADGGDGGSDEEARMLRLRDVCAVDNKLNSPLIALATGCRRRLLRRRP